MIAAKIFVSTIIVLAIMFVAMKSMIKVINSNMSEVQTILSIIGVNFGLCVMVLSLHLLYSL